jgi:hypothetical protein
VDSSIVIVATGYADAVPALQSVGSLAGKIVIDITNPLNADYSGLTVGHDTSAAEEIAKAVRRVWWPIIAVAAVRSRTARRVLLGAALASRHPVRLADDVAYSIGVWRGMAAERTLAPLVPAISSWPGRRPATTPTDSPAQPAHAR